MAGGREGGPGPRRRAGDKPAHGAAGQGAGVRGRAAGHRPGDHGHSTDGPLREDKQDPGKSPGDAGRQSHGHIRHRRRAYKSTAQEPPPGLCGAHHRRGHPPGDGHAGKGLHPGHLHPGLRRAGQSLQHKRRHRRRLHSRGPGGREAHNDDGHRRDTERPARPLNSHPQAHRG